MSTLEIVRTLAVAVFLLYALALSIACFSPLFIVLSFVPAVIFFCVNKSDILMAIRILLDADCRKGLRADIPNVRSKLLVAGIGLIGAVILCGWLIPVTGIDLNSSSSSPSHDNGAAAAPAHQAVPLTKEEEIALAVDTAINGSCTKENLLINQAYDDDNNPLGRYDVVVYLHSESGALIIICSDTIDVLEALQPIDEINSVCFMWTTDLYDIYGNSTNDNVARMLFYSDTIAKINFDNVLVNNLPEIADELYIHPAIQDD